MPPGERQAAGAAEAVAAASTMTLGFRARETARRLAAANIEAADLEARLLLSLATGLPAGTAVIEPNREIDDAACARLDALLARRLLGEPIARLAGQQEFYGRPFLLGPETLVPRADSETIIDAALDFARRIGTGPQALRILDLGTGSGCLLLTLLAEIPDAIGVGVDRSLAALRVAAENAKRLGVGDRTLFVAGHWHAPLRGPFDIVVANPPYVRSGELATLAPEVRCHDPRLALDGGADGLECYRDIVVGLAPLVPSGAVLFEVGRGQAADVESILVRVGLAGPSRYVTIRHDLSGVQRCVAVMPQ